MSNDNTPDGAPEDRKGYPKGGEPETDISTGEDTKQREESPNEDGPTTNTAPKDADSTEVDDGLVTESDMRGQEEETRSNDRLETNQEPLVMPEPLNEEPVQQEKSDGSEIPENDPAVQEQGQNDQEVLDGSENTDINQACSETLREPGSLNVHDDSTPVSTETIDNPKNDNADRFDERAAAELQERTVSMEAVKQDLLYGDASVQCPKTAKIVRIFLSSTFTGEKLVVLCVSVRACGRGYSSCEALGVSTREDQGQVFSNPCSP